MTNPNCLFCKIAAGEIRAELVYEDEVALAVFDIRPRTPGHVFLIPRQHAPTLADLPEELVGPLFGSVRKVAKLLKEKLQADGLTIGMNQGRASGQEVDHLHIHLLPRWRGDGGGSIQSVVNNIPDEEQQRQVKEKLGRPQTG